MEDLVGRKLRCVYDFSNMTIGKIYEIKKHRGIYISLIEYNGEYQEYDTYWINGKGFELLLNEPQFKQGDKVLVSYNEIDWHETEFVCYYKDYYYTINGRAKYIKPYEEKIKVGDWVKNNKGGYVFKYDNESDSKINLTKITDEVLINKLNEL